jgi:hypothetical protein
MTTIYPSDEVCGVCGNSSKQTSIGSSGQYESPDLDTRPGDLYRSTMKYWVYRCPQCGYCDSSLTKAPEGVKDIINSQEYKEILAGSSGFNLAYAFIAQSYIYEILGDFSTSTWAQIHAAWAWDDDRLKEAARECRLKAFELLQKLWTEGKMLFEEVAFDYAFAADLLRRSRKLMTAEIIEKGLNSNPNEFTRKLLLTQKILFDKRESSCYKMDDMDKILDQNKISMDSKNN